MLESTLSSLLIGVAGKYAHVSAPDVGVGLSGGRLVLENVRLRADAFNFPTLPFAVLAGRAGRLRVNVPWSALSHAPVTVYIENVHLIAGPRRRPMSRHKGRERERRVKRPRDMARMPKEPHEHAVSEANDEYRSDLDVERADNEELDSEFDSERSNSEYGESSDDDDEEDDEDAELAQRSKDGRRTELETGKSMKGAGDAANHDRWHETLLGRLGFNVAVDIVGLKVEYRDKSCISVLSLASCKAYSADRDWQPAFVPLDGGGVAVAMRKVIKLNGLHWVMLPRLAMPRESHRSRAGTIAAERLSRREEIPKGAVRRADLDAFEARSPILDGIAVTLKVLLCNSEGAEMGFHVDLDVELEDPLIHLSARQISWIDTILSQGGKPSYAVASVASRSGTRNRVSSSNPSYSTRSEVTERALNTLAYSDQDRIYEHIQTDSDMTGQNERLAPKALDGQSSEDETHDTNGHSRSITRNFVWGNDSTEPHDVAFRGVVGPAAQRVLSHSRESRTRQKKVFSTAQANKRSTDSSGRLLSLWQVIIGENVDESVDDAAVALGFAESPDMHSPPRAYDANDHDRYHARQAVTEAALAGGYTFRVRVTTPDLATREAVETLTLELDKERKIRSQLESAEELIAEAHKKVSIAEREAALLRERNVSLVHELQDLERMARSANTSKDVVIRQMEAALVKAERQLQAIAQEQIVEQSTRRQDGARVQEIAQPRESDGDEGLEAVSSKQRRPIESGHRKPALGGRSSDGAMRHHHERRNLTSDEGGFQASTTSTVAHGRKVVKSSAFDDEHAGRMTDNEKAKLVQVIALDGLTMV